MAAPIDMASLLHKGWCWGGGRHWGCLASHPPAPSTRGVVERATSTPFRLLCAAGAAQRGLTVPGNEVSAWKIATYFCYQSNRCPSEGANPG